MPPALRRLLDQRAQPIPARLRNGILIAATVGIVLASFWAWSSSGLSASSMEWLPILIAFAVAAPLSLLLKAAEFHVAARIVGQSPGRGRSLEVAVVSSAANLLPLPGSLLVTVHSLSEDGSNYRQALAASAVPGLSWLGVTGIIGGTAISVEGPSGLGLLVVAGGFAALGTAVALFRATAPLERRASLGLTILAVEVGWLGVSALRLGLAVSALGLAVEPTQALALSVAGALTVAIGFFPGGLGIREALIAGLAPMIGLPFDTGILIGSLDRVVWLAFLALAAAALTLTKR
jgi:hypothetical protein